MPKRKDDRTGSSTHGKRQKKAIDLGNECDRFSGEDHLHQGSTLEELSPDYSDNSFTKYTSELDNWFAFAVAKKVQKLVINMKGATCWPAAFADDKPYKSLFGISCPKSLRNLSLTFGYISGELVEHFLSCHPLLEHLCISGSEDYMNLKVSGSSLRLKSLQVSECWNVFGLEICAPKLESLIYEGVGQYKGDIVLKHVPSLVNLSMSEVYDYLDQGFGLVRNYFPQLLTLNLHLNLDERMFMLPKFPELTSLKELSLSVYARDNRSLLDLTPLIERSPSLHKFTFKLDWRPPSICRRKIRKPPVCRHQCLKVVKFSGFVASVIDTELARYLIKNAIMLEKFIIECPTKLDFATTMEKMRARRDCALKIGNKLPPGVEFIVPYVPYGYPSSHQRGQGWESRIPLDMTCIMTGRVAQQHTFSPPNSCINHFYSLEMMSS